MLRLACDRARELGVAAAALVVADAQALPFGAASFASVVCTLGLNAIPDDQAAVAEMYRVLRPGGRLVLLGHVVSPYRVVRANQRVIERWLLPVAGDHQTRQPLLLQAAASSSTTTSDPGPGSSSGWWRPSPAIGDPTATQSGDANLECHQG